jgi:tetratricopeptide (TPR) repeat protein
MPRGHKPITRRAAMAALVWLVMAIPADGQETPRRWVRIVHGDVEVLGSASDESLRLVASQIALVKDALAALVPPTARIAVPVTVLLDCDGTPPAAFVERPWRVYVVGRCRPVWDDDGQAAERYARIVLRRAVHSLPLWLQVGVARFATAAARLPTGGFQFATFQAADLRGYLHPRAPAREVFSAREGSEIWQNRQRRAAFLRQSLVYVHRIVEARDLGACFGQPDTRDDPTARLRRCLGGDIDTFHDVVMERWSEGLTRVRVPGGAEPPTLDARVVPDGVWETRVIDVLLATEALPVAKRRIGEWGLTAQRDAAMRGLLARMALASGDIVRARRLFDDAVATHAEPLDAYHYAAMLLAPAVRAQTIEAVPTADAVRAQELLGATVGQQPFADALALLGIAMLATGDHSRAIESLTAAVETSWDESTALWLARAYAAGRLNASARRLADSLRASSDHVEVQRQAERLLRDVPPDQGDAAGVPVLPPLAAGEQRARGRLLSIDCSDDWVTLVVETPRGTERFVNARLSLLQFVTFGAAPAPATCGPRPDAEPVVVNWRTAPTQPPYATGVASAVAFLQR